MKALSFGSWRSIRANSAVAYSTGDNFLSRISSAASARPRYARSPLTVRASSPDRRAPAPVSGACRTAGASGGAPCRPSLARMLEVFVGQTIEPEYAGLVAKLIGHRILYPVVLSKRPVWLAPARRLSRRCAIGPRRRVGEVSGPAPPGFDFGNSRFEGRGSDREAVSRLIMAGGEVSRFHDPARPYLHREDVEIALDIDRYDFAIRVRIEDSRPVARIE